ncbi:glycosyltransferase involved in cell wall biosynthesis [Rhizobium pisi]|uniref:Glycosyltransferase involved in cell wall biosynthesis n=1 Tax=Rhizobium pisi TaxID=574561 RepID=A0A7W5G3S6_9HYPH|nr:glycosyltransferase involved in cell wall biosynthesis [Rhizobium pisi]
MIEAMACGTPVIAFGCGSVPEVIDSGVSGILVDSVTEAADNVEWALRMDRRRVRATYEKRFTAERMARDYLDLYRNLPGVRTKAAPLRRSNGHPLDLQVVA